MSDNSQDGTIGNQQERLFFEIGYLIGMIDGEGCCQFRKKYLHPGSQVTAPCITIYNTNPDIIQRVKEALEYLEIPYWQYSPKMHGKEVWQGWRIEIIGLKRIKKLTDILLKYPSGKKERLQVLADFVDWRLNRSQWRYSEKDQAYFKRLSELNKLYRGKQKTESSETLRSDVNA